MAYSIYFDYRTARYSSDYRFHQHTAASLDEARNYCTELRKRIIAKGIHLDYIEVKDANGTLVWAWGKGAC